MYGKLKNLFYSPLSLALPTKYYFYIKDMLGKAKDILIFFSFSDGLYNLAAATTRNNWRYNRQ